MLTNKHNKHLDASNVRSKHPSEKSVTPEPDPNIIRDTQKSDQKNNKHGDSKCDVIQTKHWSPNMRLWVQDDTSFDVRVAGVINLGSGYQSN